MQRNICFLWIFVTFLGPLSAKAQSVEQLYQDGQHKEQILGDLQAAILSYQKAVEKHEQSRQTAAQAQFRIGRCYEKLGNTDEAVKAYRQLLQDFDDQTEVTAEARARLAALGHPVSPSIVVRQVWAPADDVHGMPSPDGRYLTYVDWNTANLALRDLTTGENRSLTDEGTWNTPNQKACDSEWSPDGQQVAYEWLNKDIWELRIIRLDGAKPRVLYRNEEVKYTWLYAWSQDGQYILAWFGKVAHGRGEIGLVSVADGSVRTVKSEAWSPIKMDLSPDGRYIVCDSREDSPQRDIFSLTVDGGRQTPLVTHPANDYAPVWAPDGKQIVFVSNRTGTPTTWTLEVVDGKPRGEVQIIKQDMTRKMPMGFTRDGAFYYALRSIQGGGYMVGDVYIATRDPATGKVVAPPEKIPQRFEGANASPDWSPDGKYLAYVSVRGLFREIEGYCALVIYELETGEARELPLKHKVKICWSPDGRSILAAGQDYERAELYIIDVQTGDITSVMQAQSGIQIWDVGWSSDGKEIFYGRVRIRRTGYIWSIVARELETGGEKELGRGQAIALSPDGQQLVFHKMQALQVIPSAGGEPREVLRLPPSEIFPFGIGPAWTPDGRYIIVGKGRRNYPLEADTRELSEAKADAAQLFEAWQIPVEGGEPQKLGLAMEAFHELSLHPDGRRIAFTQPGSARYGEVWAMENFLPELKAAK